MRISVEKHNILVGTLWTLHAFFLRGGGVSYFHLYCVYCLKHSPCNLPLVMIKVVICPKVDVWCCMLLHQASSGQPPVTSSTCILLKKDCIYYVGNFHVSDCFTFLLSGYISPEYDAFFYYMLCFAKKLKKIPVICFCSLQSRAVLSMFT